MFLFTNYEFLDIKPKILEIQDGNDEINVKLWCLLLIYSLVNGYIR